MTEVIDNTDAEEGECRPVLNDGFVNVSGPSVVVIEEDSRTGTKKAHLFRPERPGVLRYTGVLSERGTQTPYSNLNSTYKKEVAKAIEETEYEVENKV